MATMRSNKKIPADKARARNDLNTASRKLCELFRQYNGEDAAQQLEQAVESALVTFDYLRTRLNGGSA